MKNLIRWSSFLASAAMLVAVCVSSVLDLSAQTIPPDQPAAVSPAAVVPAPATASLTWQQAAIAILTPLIIAGVKLLVPRIPRVWLPLIAPVVGCLLDVLAHYTTGSTLSPTVALVLGAAGVGLREVVDQVKQAGSGGPAVPPAKMQAPSPWPEPRDES